MNLGAKKTKTRRKIPFKTPLMLRCFSELRVVNQPLRSRKTWAGVLESQAALLTEPPNGEKHHEIQACFKNDSQQSPLMQA